MKIKTKDNIIKRWYKLCQPHKGYWWGQIISYTFYTIFLSIITIFAARTINAMYTGNWVMAFINLGLELLTIILRCLALKCEFWFYGKQHKAIRNNIAKKLYNKMLTIKDDELKKISKEKVVNIALNNMSNAAEFADSVAIFVAYIIQVVLILFVVFSSNILAGIIILCVGVLNFFVYLFFNKKLGKILLKRNEYDDDVYKSFLKIVGGKNVITEMKSQKKYEKEFLKSMDTYSDEYAKYYNVHSNKAHLYYATWNILVYCVTAFLLFLVSKGNLDIAVYLVIVPYLTSCTDKLNTLFDRTSSLENMRVDVDRVNLILELDDKQLIKYGKFNAVDSGYNLGLIDVSYNSHSDAGKLINADITFKQDCINLIKGEKGSGKRNIFNLLRRQILPDKGKVLLNNLNLYYYNEKTFKHHIEYCASHPEFITGSIKENLTLNEKKFNKIKEVCTQIGVDAYIRKLPKKYNTEMADIKSKSLLFLLGLARAVLSNSNILLIYEFPEDATKTLKNTVLTFIKTYCQNKTIILFSHSDFYDDIAEAIFEVTNGKVKEIKIDN